MLMLIIFTPYGPSRPYVGSVTELILSNRSLMKIKNRSETQIAPCEIHDVKAFQPIWNLSIFVENPISLGSVSTRIKIESVKLIS